MGIIYDIPPSTYHRDNIHPGLTVEDMRERHVSKSLLWKWFPNPARWSKKKNHGPTKAMEKGSLLDCKLLTPDLFEKEYSVGEPFPQNKDHLAIVEALKVSPERAVMSEYKEFRTNDAKAWKAEQEAAGRVIVRDPAALELAKEHVACEGKNRISESLNEYADAAVAEIHAHEGASHFLDVSDTQVALYGELCGVKIKALLDLAPRIGTHYENALGDLKKSRYWDKRGFSQQVGSLGYHVQAAISIDLWNSITGENRDEWYFIVSEDEEPHTANFFELNPDAIDIGRGWYRQALQEWKRMLETGRHPEPYDVVETIDLPKWHYFEEYGS